MPTDITLNSITGQQPYDIYVCDLGLSTCIYIDTINNSSIPYTFQIPTVYSNLDSLVVRVVDDNDCLLNENIVIV